MNEWHHLEVTSGEDIRMDFFIGTKCVFQIKDNEKVEGWRLSGIPSSFRYV